MAVVEGKGEHAAQPAHHLGAVIFVQVHEDFGIRTGGEAMPPAFQFPSEFGVVVNFSVVNHHQTLVLIKDRLPTAFQVQNAQPAVGQAHRALQEIAVLIRAAVG